MEKLLSTVVAAVSVASGQSRHSADIHQLTHSGQNAEAHSAPDMDTYRSLLAENLTAPMKMELVVAGADGSGAHAITNFGCASFAETFTPDGRDILFSSNKRERDSRHFELYLINVDGTGLEQVTPTGGFHVVSGVLAGWENAGVLLRSGCQGALRVQHLHRALEVGS